MTIPEHCPDPIAEVVLETGPETAPETIQQTAPQTPPEILLETLPSASPATLLEDPPAVDGGTAEDVSGPPRELNPEADLEPEKSSKTPIYRDFTLLQMAAIIFLVDQFTKFLVREFLPFGYSYPFDGSFRITHTHNTGSAFGILQGQNTPLIFVSFIGIFVLVMIYRSQPRATNLLRTSLALQIGGAFGNLLDRLRLGSVTDFIDVGAWPVFNLADASIVTGLILLGWLLLRPGARNSDSPVVETGEPASPVLTTAHSVPGEAGESRIEAEQYHNTPAFLRPSLADMPVPESVAVGRDGEDGNSAENEADPTNGFDSGGESRDREARAEAQPAETEAESHEKAVADPKDDEEVAFPSDAPAAELVNPHRPAGDNGESDDGRDTPAGPFRP